MSENNSLTPEQQLQIEGYKSLSEYGCQMSQDHISTDRVMIPLSLAPAFFVLAPPTEHDVSYIAKVFILLGGTSLIVFWMLRNKRSEKRLYAIWDTLRLIEERLGFKAHRAVQQFMESRWLRDNGRFDKRLPLRDFTLKKRFGWFGLGFYVFVLIYVSFLHAAPWLCC